MITFEIKDNGSIKSIEVPEGISLTLMDVLKASSYSILATCGGMALCATCRVQFEKGAENLNTPTDAELDMLDTLPDANHLSRLACQIRIDESIDGALIALRESNPT